MAYTPPLFQHVFVPNSCNNEGDDDDDGENGSVMILMIKMIRVEMLI